VQPATAVVFRRLGLVEAAFFDLDKTVIARPSMVAFGAPLRREGLVSRRLLLRALWAQLIYLTLGADEVRLERVRDAALRVSKGWEQRRISAIVRETITEIIEPIVYAEALELMQMHREAGRKVFIVSASPEEIVAPLAQYLGADEAIATRALLDEHGCYTGGVERYCYGPEKVRVLEELAERDGIDLDGSYAYSDSATDAPMLAAVGHAIAVNPDRELLRLARTAGWEVVRFSHRVKLRERVAFPSATTIGVGTVAASAVAGGAAAGWWLWNERRRQPATTRWGRATNALGSMREWSSEALPKNFRPTRAGPSWRPAWPGTRVRR
jgi:HAD superfamily hydrolase (TIGR01490 family)